MSNQMNDRQRYAVDFVAKNPGCTKKAVAEHMGYYVTNRDNSAPYNFVNRLIANGWIVNNGDPTRNNRAELYVVE